MTFPLSGASRAHTFAFSSSLPSAAPPPRHPVWPAWLACALSPLAAAAAQAASEGPSAAPASTQQVQIVGQHYDNGVGSSDAASQGVIRAELLKSRPALRPGEVLEFVPGVIVTQHSGDGKANQYFLRGFNLDHGTDFATSVDGMPVNMPTHGHGQGYADLNFLIPELVDRIAYRKGPYFARGGDFSAAGAADIVYRTRFDAPWVQATLGPDAYRRLVAAGSGDVGPGVTALAAVESMGNDGPWTLREGLRRRNGVFTLSGGTPAQGWQASAMAYTAHWRATDQVPESLLGQPYDGRVFGRFDTLDTSDGGETSRASLSGQWHRVSEAGTTRIAAYAMRYRLQLWSNFTYALERPDTGDQFSQRDRRSVLGLAASHAVEHAVAGWEARSEWGLQWRHDRIGVALYDTQARQVLGVTRDDTVRQAMLGVHGQTALTFNPWLRGLFGLRADHLQARVDSHAGAFAAANSGRASAVQWSPRASLVFGPFARTEFFVNAGRGLHSNDARGMTQQADPRTGAAADRVQPLVASRGQELGLRTEALPGLQSSLALWRLDSASELVYVGDAGSTEAAQASRRHGVEFNNRWQPWRWLLVDADLAWTHARFADGGRIPNAVDRVASLSATLRELGPWSASLGWRYLGSGALVEDNSVRSTPAITADLRLSHTLPAAWGFGRDSALTVDVFNLFNRRVDDIQYAYTSRLPGGDPWFGRHVHPAEPRTLRVTLRLGF
ncbi:TonB-dependent receptor [Ideonella sp. DXS22W]|uniref:TonB-dependent receptor n=1 Tax=Pseudaquabacterium inlustre TaxID=2984192 RepID=A0ABU9CHX8_9BURK